jgi:hypothetical protein
MSLPVLGNEYMESGEYNEAREIAELKEEGNKLQTSHAMKILLIIATKRTSLWKWL